MSPFARFESFAYAAFRVVAGFLFLFHGLQKLFGMYGGTQMPLMSQMGLAGVIELVGGALIALGAFTWLAAFICSGQMAVAYFQAHQPGGLWPVQNGGELAALYCFAFLFIATRGGGPYSVDGMWRRR